MDTLDDRCEAAVGDVMRAYGLPVWIEKKSDSLLMKVIGFLIRPFNPRFMTDYLTTIPFLGRIYVPEREGGMWRSIAHEGVHLDQAKRDGQLPFALKYLFPQCLAPLALLAFVAFAWTPMLFALLFILALAPWPAPWRVQYEREAYIVSAACDHLLGHDIRSDEYMEYMMHHYVGWGYYHPSWDPGRLRLRLAIDMVRAEWLAEEDGSSGPSTDYSRSVIWLIREEMERKSA
jgi:hypothetical protein